jgi:tetratricopeptide (TPR) repeat protein
MTSGTPREAIFMFASAGDWARVVPAARESLASDPEDAVALSLLSLGLSNLDQPAQAVEAGRRAVGVDPELGLAHYALASALLSHDDVAGAERAARESLRLDADSGAYALLSQVFTRQRRWDQALEAAEQGLELDPEHVGCANLRARALSGLGRGDEADDVAREALANDPDNAGSHANHGWLLMRQQKYGEALESFRTALRLDATLESARAGIVEALKARNGVYRLLLRYAMWMGNLDARTRWFVLLGLFFGSRIARTMLRENPALWPLLGPALAAYAVFALSTWLAEPLSNLLLRLNPFGRLALSRAETLASNLVGACLVTATAAALLGAITSTVGWFIVALVAFLLMMPISGAFSGYGTRAWGPLRAALIVLAAVGVVGAALSFVSMDLAVYPLIAMLVGTFAFGWGANYLNIKFS